MKKILLLLALTMPLAAQEGFDFRTLDKLGANAKNKTNITLDSNMLKLAAGFLGDDKDADSIRPLVDSLKGVYIRSYEFTKAGQYNEGDLEPLRAFLKQGQWNRIVESKSDDESSEVYLQPVAGNRLGGVAIISAEAKEVTVVYISGNLKPEDIAKLSGSMGIPEIGPGLKQELKDRKAGDRPKMKKDDEE